MLHNDAQRIMEALEGAGGAAHCTRGWPKSFEKLPCIAVSEAGNTPAAFLDDEVYMDELIYDVRVFAIQSGDKDRIAASVEEIMHGLRYTRVLVYDEDTADVRMKVMRYRTYR